MSTRVAITHTLHQRFEWPVRLSTHWLRLRPAPHTRARITAYSMALHADSHYINWLRDPFENHLARVDLPEPLRTLGLEVGVIAELTPVNPFEFLLEPEATRHPFEYAPQLRKELAPYTRSSAPGPRLNAWLARLGRDPAYTVQRLEAVNRYLGSSLAVADAMRPGLVDAERVLAEGRGSCWDLAWLLVLALRHLGVAARFTSGYRVTLAARPDAQDGVARHAWAEAYLPGAGWVGLDPVSGLFTTQSHIPLACAPDPLRVMPIVGYREACDETRQEHIVLRRLRPRAPEWPLTQTQWADIRALGCHVQRDLLEQGLRPSLGVGLSLVASQPHTSREWQITALGREKRRLAEALLMRLRDRLAPGGAVQLGQGRWYAGDALPRWRLGCFYRADGHPIWRADRRLGWTRGPHAQGAREAGALSRAIAGALGIHPDHVIPAHEDRLYALSKRAVPPDDTPPAEDLRDPERRRAWAARLSACDDEPVGYALPLRWDHAAMRWVSGRWSFRRRGLYLLPGDSAMGYRLPLGGLVGDEAEVKEAQIERCQFEERAPLPNRDGEVSARLSSASAPDPGLEPANGRPMPRTALCVQARGGRLYVFLPPISHVEHYLDLVAAIEDAAAATDTAVIMEGYEPPEDYRVQRIVLEPDAGVLRLMLPQLPQWESQLELLRIAYQEAARLGLHPERIASDGRRLPSGGGGRLVLGGERPADSPFLARPEILAALIAYWQRHPSLSYLFAGRAIGPAGPSPRPDEGRDEALYELSIALERLCMGQCPLPWQVDRTLRHLLADPAGDLKRAEIRIDQLYPPQRASLRLGRIMIHAFETAPEPRLAALQSLLVLGLLGRFAKRPGDVGLRRWGGVLHDRFMLPDPLWADLRAVIEDLNAVGYPFQLEWFEPLMALRFPLLGRVQIGGITLTLRAAHEPWPLLAEEVSGGGVARFIDMANERLQVCVSGLTPQRYVLACNGRRVPLQPGEVHGQYLAGVRYKVANPPATLHPTVGPVEALVFDLIDTWSGRTIGGCSYLPSRPQPYGPVATPAVPVSPGAPWTSGLPPSPPVSIPPPSPAGRFLERGSALGPMRAPPLYADRRHPYLLDLVRVSSDERPRPGHR